MSQNDPILMNSQTPLVFDNTRSEIISIMPDTLDIKFQEFENNVENKGRIWNNSGIGLTILITLITVENFKSLFLPSEVWQAIFYLVLLYTVVNVIKDIIIYRRNKISRQQIISSLLDESNKKGMVSNSSISKLRILEANWGTDEKNINVVPKLRNSIKDDKLTISTTNDYFGIDPVPGTKKRLEVVFIYDDRYIKSKVIEGVTYEIPDPEGY